MECFSKTFNGYAINCFPKTLHLRCLAWFWIRLCNIWERQIRKRAKIYCEIEKNLLSTNLVQISKNQIASTGQKQLREIFLKFPTPLSEKWIYLICESVYNSLFTWAFHKNLRKVTLKHFILSSEKKHLTCWRTGNFSITENWSKWPQDIGTPRRQPNSNNMGEKSLLKH